MAELVVALDVPDAKSALEMAESLAGSARWLKIGLQQFTRNGPEIVRAIRNIGFKVFLDLKFYDIPNTVAAAVAAACELHVDMLTLHCQGGEKMCGAAMRAASAYKKAPLVFGVTALTSFADGEMPGIKDPVGDYAFELARDAAKWGLNGIVCSGFEAARIKKHIPGLLCLCPGIRPQGADKGDQSRVMTPAQAVANGADFIVVGRPVLNAPDPMAAAKDIIAEIGEKGIF